MAVSSVLEDNDKVDASPQLPKIQPPTTRKRSIDDTEDAEVSFILNIFPDGYSIRNPSEICFGNDQNCLPKYLRPYDRTSESLFAKKEIEANVCTRKVKLEGGRVKIDMQQSDLVNVGQNSMIAMRANVGSTSID
ncbi:hypothetical protein L1887_19801 [Cichorium endivia]|nr:hypothetical protein L1887_19801 [Cichorium endivia]